MIYSKKRTVFRDRSWRKTVRFGGIDNVQGQNPSLVTRHVETMVFIIRQISIFRTTRSFENWVISPVLGAV